MNIGKLLGVLSPGLSATGLFGHDAQGIGGGALGALSPLLALLMKHKKSGAQGIPEQAAAPAVPVQAPLAQNPAQPPAQVPHQGMDPAKRQQIAQMLLQQGQGFANPFRPSY